MSDNVANSGSDWILFCLPLLALLAFTFFRLDEVFTSRKKGSPENRPSPEIPVKRGRPLGADPDGRAWDDPPAPKN